jgi:hypothetical protein
MNPFTRFLLGKKSKKSEALEAFVERCDTLEGLVIRVFRGKGADPADEESYNEIRLWLVENYPLWENDLRPYWQAALVGGQPAEQDPIRRLLSAEQAKDFVGDWEAMQYLPAAREALNRYIQAVEGEQDET